MIILLGGLLGSGRRMLAHNVARKCGFHYLETNQTILDALHINRNGEVREKKHQPASDAEWMHIYAEIVSTFPTTSKMYPDIVMDLDFHRAGPREYFLKEARTYFKDVYFIWIDSTEQSVRERLFFMLGRKMIRSVEGALQHRQRIQNAFQPFTDSIPRFNCRSIEYAQADVAALMEKISADTGIIPKAS